MHSRHKMQKPKLLWLQSITCNGNAHSFFNLQNFDSLMRSFDLLYYPLIDTKYSLENIYMQALECDVLILEGAFKPRGYKKFDKETFALAKEYSSRAQYTITMGTCSTFGGIFKEAQQNKITGFCFNKERKKPAYKKYTNMLISLPGCPAHPKWLAYVLEMILQKRKIEVDEFYRPIEIFTYTAHSGCVRNEYFEWKIDIKNYGEKEGCLFYENGCRGPFTNANCNKMLWNDISSKTRVGTPCFGCTEPSFPQRNLFSTKTNMGIPANMPLGIPPRAYLSVTGVAK
ncbi:MAG: hydrogenase, partial [Campylobacterales bacterium]|nr:hydrogenase [Campylobacterales bacterium]